jgi:hypothetical protein
LKRCCDRHKNSVTDPRESDQGQKKREKKNCFVKVVRQPKHMEHEAQRGNVQNKSEQRRIDPGPGDNPEHEQNKKENRGQGRPQTTWKRKSVTIWSGLRVAKVCLRRRDAVPAIRLGAESNSDAM